MKIISSVCTNLYFPKSRSSIQAFQEMAHFLADRFAIQGVEFYHDGGDAAKIGRVLAETGLSGIYIAVIPLKEKLLHLCDTDEGGRQAALALMEGCIEQAVDNGVKMVMFNSGRIGPDPAAGVAALLASIGRLYEYVARRGYDLGFCLEPCDSGLDAKQLIGPAQRTKALLEALHEEGYPLSLTLDTAHVAEEGENFVSALTQLRAYCNHIHFANCVLGDPASPLYGDKHVGYEYEGTAWGFGALDALLPSLQALYPGEEPLRIGLEVLCREQDPYAYFERAWQKLSYLHPSGGNPA